jgi:hypothetical protein
MDDSPIRLTESIFEADKTLELERDSPTKLPDSPSLLLRSRLTNLILFYQFFKAGPGCEYAIDRFFEERLGGSGKFVS